jgi:hypothetical protein
MPRPTIRPGHLLCTDASMESPSRTAFPAPANLS